MDLLLFILALVALYFSLKAKSAKGRLVGGLIQLAFVVVVYIFTKDLLGTSIHDVVPGKVTTFLIMYFVSLAAIIIFGLLGLGNLFISILGYASFKGRQHPVR